MNAITMKLENKQPPGISSKIKGKDSVIGKKSKNHRKKSNLANTDKDALLNDHGLGRKSGEINYDLNDSKSSNLQELSSSKKSRPRRVCPKNIDKMLTTSKTMHERLQQILSPTVKEKITSIISQLLSESGTSKNTSKPKIFEEFVFSKSGGNDVKALSDVEKLFLYLQLPTGSPFEADPFKIRAQNPLGKKADDEGMIAVTWIQSHLEEDPEVSLPKQEVYDEYQSYCQLTGTDALCAADFGKVMKQIFPSVKPRRLGTRGNSRYCYSGLRKKLNLKIPTLPNVTPESETTDMSEEKDEVTSAACHILFEWAEKLLGFKFSCLKDLASHLLENMYVDNRSVAAFTVLLDGSPQLIEKGFSNCEGKKSEAQIHLQRKIQEKELIKEQKKKLQEQRSNLTSSKLLMPKKKGSKSKKSKLLSEKSPEKDPFLSKSIEENSPSSSVEKSSMQVDKNTLRIKEEEIDLELVMDMEQPEGNSVNDTQDSANKKANLDHQSPESCLQTEDTPTKKTKIMLPRSKTPVCIPQSLPGIIIVPSLPQLADINKTTVATPKYKRIQPKPVKGEGFSAVARARAGSLGSTTINKPKNRTHDGRHSSHAWLQSVSSPEGNDSSILKCNTAHIKPNSLFQSPQKSSIKKGCFIAPREKLKDAALHLGQKSSAFSDTNASNELLDENSTLPVLKSNSPSLPLRESSTLKRPLDESEKTLKTKKLLLDANSSKESTGNAFTQDHLPIKMSNIPIQRPSIQQNSANDEVSIHEIEGDALNDYYRLNNSQNLLATSDQSEYKDLKRRDFNKDISQLRMLLEQKISCGQTNSALLNSLKDVARSDSSSLHNPKENLFYSQSILLDEDKSIPGHPLNKHSLNNLCNVNIGSLSLEEEKHIQSISQMDSIEKLLDCHLASQVNEQAELISGAEMYLNSKNNSQQIDLELSDLQQSLMNSNNELLNAGLLSNVEYATPQISSYLPMRVNTYTQVPSVPQSPNTRRRAFNFMPISPSHTPIPDNLITSGTSASPVPNQFPRNMMSIGVGPSQPPSNAGSPFVSPRSTPVSMCRSRHSSGQSTSRHTPFQNFDSGVSSVSSSPFISPQPTPVPVSRLRHNSSHGSNKTVTFCSVNSPHIINSLSTTNSLGQLRSRHNSGPSGPHLSGNLITRNAPLSPLVSEPSAPTSFVFPTGNELRYRHNSDSNTTSLSPVSEQTSSSSSCTSNLPDLTSVNDIALSQSFLNDSAADLLISGNSSNFKQVRQRHASSSVIYSKPYLTTKDSFSQEIQNLLKSDQINGSIGNSLSNRSQSVPLHQMLQNLSNYCFLTTPLEETPAKSQPTTPMLNQVFTFPLLNQAQENAALSTEILNGDKSFTQTSQIEWSSLDNTGDLEVSSARRNLANLLDPPLSDDLQTTLEDLRDCDNDFSKFAQELELSQTEDGSL